jgi:hypothetical protein
MTTDKASAQQIDAQLMDVASRTKLNFMELAKLAAEAISKRVFEHMGYLDEVQYFDQRIQVPYRTLRRWLQANAGVERLEKEEQEEAREKLGNLGVHKAASLGPVLGRPTVDWRDEVKFAERATTSAVQARASDITGAKPRGLPSEPGMKFLKFIINQMPPNKADEVEAIFEAVMKFADVKHPVAAFLLMCDIVRNELGNHGVEIQS